MNCKVTTNIVPCRWVCYQRRCSSVLNVLLRTTANYFLRTTANYCEAIAGDHHGQNHSPQSRSKCVNFKCNWTLDMHWICTTIFTALIIVSTVWERTLTNTLAITLEKKTKQTQCANTKTRKFTHATRRVGWSVYYSRLHVGNETRNPDRVKR